MPPADSVETRTSWIVALVSTAVITVTFGAPFIAVVALKPIAADLGSPRSVPALANSLAYFGAGIGGIAMGWWADRIGVAWVVLLGVLMVGAGTAVSALGGDGALYLGHGLMMGLLGNAGVFAPLLTYVSRWFDRRRGVALSLVSSGQQIAGAIWPPLFRATVDTAGWRATMLWYGVFVIGTALPMVWLLRHRPPRPAPAAVRADPHPDQPVLGLPANAVQAVLCAAIVCCCVAMAMPMGHLVAFCSDVGYAPARGAEMLSLLLASAFLSRVIWGRLSDRIGGLKTVLIGSALQAAALAFYLVIDDLAGLYAVSAAFGIGLGGIIPSYVLAVRELFPAAEAGWRIATVIFFGLAGMALGNWLGGAIYDWAAYYQPAFAVGLAFNLVNLMLIAPLLLRGGPAMRFGASSGGRPAFRAGAE